MRFKLYDEVIYQGRRAEVHGCVYGRAEDDTHYNLRLHDGTIKHSVPRSDIIVPLDQDEDDTETVLRLRGPNLSRD